jgi:hypothetical protein
VVDAQQTTVASPSDQDIAHSNQNAVFHLELSLNLTESHGGLFEALAVLKVDAESAIFIA